MQRRPEALLSLIGYSFTPKIYESFCKNWYPINGVINCLSRGIGADKNNLSEVKFYEIGGYGSAQLKPLLPSEFCNDENNSVIRSAMDALRNSPKNYPPRCNRSLFI
jgi:hypothetical protein